MKLTKGESVCGAMWRMGCWMALGVVTMLSAGASAQAVSTTTVQGTVYLANGQPGGGSLVVSWPSFTTAAGQAIAADRLTVTIPADGFVSVNLAPNQGATPAGEYYTAVFYMSDGSTNTEYWVVPAAAQATIGQVRAQVMPAAQAVQAVNKAYVDQSISELQQSLLSASGGNLSGPLYLNGDPTQALQAADKHYVDSQVATAVPLSGGSMTGRLTLSSDPTQGLQAADKEYVDAAAGNAWPAMVLRVDEFGGVDFGAKLQACVNAVSASYGGTCDARNFSGNQTMSAGVTIASANTTVLLPCATITTASQIVMTAGARNGSLRGCALRGGSAASGSQGGTVLAYSGAGSLIQVGDPTYAVDTPGFHLDNVVINTTAATSATAMGLAAYRTQEMDVESVYFLGNSNQTGMKLDGTGNYTGGTFLDDQFDGFETAVNAIGHQVANAATTDWMNASSFVRLHIDCPTSNGNPIAGTYGINLQQGDGNTFTGGDVEGCATALHLGANAQNNTIVGLRNENSTNQVVADAGSSYNSWITGGTMFTGQLTDNGTRNSFQDTFHRSFNGLNGDWYGSQQDATLTNHYRLGIGSGNERGLLNRYQTDSGYRWTMGLSDATGGEQFYQVLDELNNVYRLSVGQYNNGQSSTNNQTAINSAGTGAVVLNGSNNAGTGGVVIGSGGSSASTVATISNSGSAQFNGTLQVGGTAQFAGTPTVRNNADAEVDYYLWPGLSTSQKGSFTYKDWNGNSQWYMVKDASNNWALNSAVGGLDSFKAYQSTNSGDTYVNASNASGAVRVNYESGSGTAFKVYGGNSSTLYASFTGATSIEFPGLAAGSGHFCLQIDTSGYVTNTGAACGSGTGGSGTVNSSNSGYIAYYTGNGTAIGGMSSVPVGAGGTGATSAAAALQNLGGMAVIGGTMSGALNSSYPGTNSFAGTLAAGTTVLVGDGVMEANVRAFGARASQQIMTCTAAASSNTLTGCSSADFKVGDYVFIPSAGVLPTISAPTGLTAVCGSSHGGSCSGGTTVTYGYEVAAIQARPNGAVTAVTGPVTVTQPAQTKLTNDGSPDVYTTVSFTPPSPSSGGFAIYRSVNGGAYTFYSLLTDSSFNDHGHMSQIQFTCTDIGIPCTPPASPVPNDVYAQITAINGNTVTLSAYSNQPIYQVNDYLSGGVYPSTPSVNGIVTVQHDDTPAFVLAQKYWRSLPSAQHFALYMPAGTYNLHNADPWNSLSALKIDGLNNGTLYGDGNATLLTQSNDRAGIGGGFIVGACDEYPNPTNTCQGSYYRSFSNQSAPYYNLSDPVVFGTTTVTLSTPAQASNFPAGTYVNLFDNVTNYWGNYPANMYGELNLVTASNSTTGMLTLAYPTRHVYSSSLTPPFSQCSTCAGPPVISPIIGGITATNVTLRDFAYRGDNGFTGVNTIDGLNERNLTIQTAFVDESGIMRHRDMENLNITEDPFYDGNTSYFMIGAAGSSDYKVSHSTSTAVRSQGGQQMCSEGSTNISVTDSKLEIDGIADSPYGVDPVLGGDLCYGLVWEGDKIGIQNTNVSTLFRYSSETSASFIDNDVDIDNLSNTGSIPGLTNSADELPAPFVNTAPETNTIRIHAQDGSGSANLQIGDFTSYIVGTVSNPLVLYPYIGYRKMLVIPMSRNISQINLGSGRAPGLYFTLAFVQPSSGGPYTIPSSCGNSSWSTSGSGIDCPSGFPQLNSTASSTTYLNFYDDGTVVHYLGSNYASIPLQKTVVLSQSGEVDTGLSYGTWQTLTVQMTGNITQVNIGYPIAGLVTQECFVQPSSGGPYTLPAGAGSSYWFQGYPGSAPVDFIGGVAPVANPAAGSSTCIRFYNDGTTIHEISRSYLGGGAVASTAQLPVKYTLSLTPAAATVSSCVEQTFTVAGLASGQAILAANPPSGLGTHVWMSGARVGAANTLALDFCADATGGTPPAGTWTVVAY